METERTIVRLLKQLCQHGPALQDLMKGETIKLLFLGTAMRCVAKKQLGLRRWCLDILSYLLHECRAPGLLDKIHEQGCLGVLCRDLADANTETMPPGYMLELLLEVKFCLQAAASHCAPLVTAFAESQGYSLIAKYVASLEWKDGSEQLQRGNALVDIMLDLVFIGPAEASMMSTNALPPLAFEALTTLLNTTSAFADRA